MPEPLREFLAHRRVEFADTDMGNLVHFSRFFVFMETAEHQLLASLGAAVHFRHEGRLLGWPRLEAACRYLSPVRYGDLLEIRVRIARKGTTSLTYEFTFGVGERIVARGRMAAVCCVLDDPAGLRPVPIPATLVERLAEAEPA